MTGTGGSIPAGSGGGAAQATMNDPRHIAFVCPRFAPGGTVGGAETLLRRLAECLAGTGRQVTFLTTCAEDHFTWANAREPGTEQHGPLTVRYFAVNEDRDLKAFARVQTAISRGTQVSDADELLWMRQNVNSRTLEAHLREEGSRYDALVMGPYLFGLVYHAALIAPGKTYLVPCLHDEPFAYLRVMRDLFTRVRGLLFNAEPERELARRLFQLAPDRGCVVGMGMDPFEVDPEAFARRSGMTVPYVFYAGRREQGKGTPLLLDYMHAFRRRTGRDIKVVFAGKGPIEPPGELIPHVIDLGFVSELEKHEAMAGATAFIHPSVNESFGIVLLESWLARTPALVHAGSAVLSWQCRQSRAGFWFRRYPEFEEELLLLLDRPALGRAMGEAGHDYVRRMYAWDRIRDRLIGALRA